MDYLKKKHDKTVNFGLQILSKIYIITLWNIHN